MLACSPVVKVGTHRYWITATAAPDLALLREHLRTLDREEIENAGHTARQSLWRGYRNSILCEAAWIDGEVAAVWGLAVGQRPGVSLLGDVGAPWLLTTPAVEKVPIAFVKEGKKVLDRMRAVKPKLENHVLSSYSAAVRFLILLGFTVEPPEPVGKGGTLYSRFHIGF
jgi:hypothetical protein